MRVGYYPHEVAVGAEALVSFFSYFTRRGKATAKLKLILGGLSGESYATLGISKTPQDPAAQILLGVSATLL